MKQTKHKHCTSIWHHAKKGVRAGNSPVWTVTRETPSGRRDEWKVRDKATAHKIHQLALDESEEWPGHTDVHTSEDKD